MNDKELLYTQIRSDRGNEYIRFNDSHTTFTSEILKSKERMGYLEKLNLIKEKLYFEDESIDEDKMKRMIYESGLQQLTLEVTTMCNFRCKYCIFSGNYNLMRTHENTNMNWNIAKKAIDMYFGLFKEAKDYNYSRKPLITFYGGEPLINFKLIKEAVEYIEISYSEYDVSFSLTTNGSLLSDEIIDFLAMHNVNAIVSLDGPRDEHNRNRVYQDGRGSFDDVYQNIIKLSRKYGRPVFTICVYDIRSDIEQIAHFYDNEHEMICLNTTSVKSFGTDYYKKFTDKDRYIFKNNEEKMKYYFLGNNVGDYNKGLYFLDRYFLDRCATFFASFIDTSSKSGKMIKCTNPCIPGQKIFVAVDGNFYVCEKVSHTNPIGNVDTGLEYNKIVNMEKEYCDAVTNCINCKMRNECGVCNTLLETAKGFKIPADVCKSLNDTRQEQFKLALDICEKDPKWTKMAVALYYNSIEEEAKRLI